MDVRREGVAERRKKRRLILSGFGVLALALSTYGISRLEPAAPSVDRGTVYMDTVKRGEMLRQVRGPGTLVPVEIRWISAQTDGRIERRVVLPGAKVEPDTIILELSNPELEQSTQDAELKLRAAEAEFVNLRVALENRLLNERATAAGVESDFRQALLQVEADNQLAKEGLLPELTVKLSRVRAEELENRNQIEKERLAISKKSVIAQLQSEKARLAQAEALFKLRESQLGALKVKAGIEGVLQQVPVEEGQRVTAGTKLARVAQPQNLKAELRIAETQAKDVVIGLRADIDTRNGVITGEVQRIDPAVQNGTVTVDVALTGELPRGARPDLSVDGTIEIERLEDVLYVGRPAYGQAMTKVGLFVLAKDGDTAERVQVFLGRSSVTTIEVVSGLDIGDRVILSDTSQWDAFDRIRLD